MVLWFLGSARPSLKIVSFCVSFPSCLKTVFDHGLHGLTRIKASAFLIRVHPCCHPEKSCKREHDSPPGKAKGGGRLSGVLNHGLHGADETDKKSVTHCMGLNPCNPVFNPCNPWFRQPGERGCRLAFIAVGGVGGDGIWFWLRQSRQSVVKMNWFWPCRPVFICG
jgi:hypothetical protein